MTVCQINLCCIQLQRICRSIYFSRRYISCIIWIIAFLQSIIQYFVRWSIVTTLSVAGSGYLGCVHLIDTFPCFCCIYGSSIKISGFGNHLVKRLGNFHSVLIHHITKMLICTVIVWLHIIKHVINDSFLKTGILLQCIQCIIQCIFCILLKILISGFLHFNFMLMNRVLHILFRVC